MSRDRPMLRAALPLLGQLLDDATVRLVRRPVDPGWQYEARSRHAGMGWNPFRAEIYLGAESRTARWLDDPSTDLRELNEGDLFLPELAFVLHDYLHAWAALTARELLPALDFGVAPITRENIERHAFVLLATEAAATVGLDYWWLSTSDLESTLGIGTTFSRLTVDYRTTDDGELRRLDPSFCSQEPAFFARIARFYATGRFPGFDLGDARRSPVLLRWLRHELTYGETQRRHTRSWLQHLAGQKLYDDGELAGPIAADEPWQRDLLGALAERLWAKVKRGEPTTPALRPQRDATWRASERGPIDFRFTNLNALPPGALEARGMVEVSRPFWIDQLLRQASYPAGDLGALAAIREARASSSVRFVAWAARQLGATRPEGDSVVDLFFPL